MNRFKILTRLALLSLIIGLANCAPNVTTSEGVLKGVDKNCVTSNTLYHVYYAIPYAAAPVGDLRFKAPEKFVPDNNTVIINSDKYGSSCPQTATFGNPMDEDCLFLNVFTPSTNGADFDENAKRKVMVFIHGGAFQVGDATMYPTSCLSADYDIITVSIQYRLGPLGFMSSGTAALPGNYGLRDQIFALKWVKENIAKFGGDPDDVTLAGESAGATSTSLLALSEHSKGLFTKVVVMSGSALAPWAIDMTSRETFDKMALRAKCVPDPCEQDCDSKVVECLRTIKANDLIQLIARDARTSEEDIFALDGYMSYAPVVDGDVIPRDPFDLMLDKKYLEDIGALDRKYMIGMDNNEALIFVMLSLQSNVVQMQELLDRDNPVANKVVKNNLHSMYPYRATQTTIDLVMDMYFGEKKNPTDLSDLQNATNLMTDIDFLVPAVNLADHYLKARDSVDVFFFLFDLFPPLKIANFPLQGSTHGTEMAYMCDEDGIVGALIYYADVYADECKPVLDIFRSMLANFVKDGDPSIPGKVTWGKYDLSKQAYMSISATPQMKTNLFKSRSDLWINDIPETLGMPGFVRGLGRAPIPDSGNAPQGQA